MSIETERAAGKAVAAVPQAEVNYMQQYVLERMAEEPGSPMFNLVRLFRVRKGVDVQRLSDALVASARTHAALMTVLRRDEKGTIIQRQELSPDAIACPIIPAEADELLAKKSKLATNFSTFGAKLFNACIYDCGDSAYLLSDFHHLICDGYSFPLILNGARTIYEGGILAPDAYYAILSKRNEKAASPLAEDARNILRDLLREARFVSLPPEDFVGGVGIGIYRVSVTLPANFDDFLVTHRVTRHHVFLAATVLALARITAANDILIDWVFHGRVTREELWAVGAFMVDLPLTIEEMCLLTPLDVLSRVKMATFSGIKRVGAIRSVSDVNPDGRERLTFNYQSDWGELVTSGPVQADGPFGWMIEETMPIIPPAALPENPFNVEIMEHNGATRLEIEYDAGRFAEATVRRYADLFTDAMHAILSPTPIDCRKKN